MKMYFTYCAYRYMGPMLRSRARFLHIFLQNTSRKLKSPEKIQFSVVFISQIILNRSLCVDDKDVVKATASIWNDPYMFSFNYLFPKAF